MKAYRRFSNVGQMGVALAAFAGLLLAMEFGGLVDWAKRLDLGPERTVAGPVVLALDRGLAWTRLDRVRRAALVELARVGWGDDPAAVAAAKGEDSRHALTPEVPKAAAPERRLVMQPKVAMPAVAGASTMVSVLPPMTPVEAGKMRTVVLAGDSMMAVGLSSTILREAPRYKDLAVVKAFKSGTGLARPEVFNWQQEYPAMLGAAQPDVVLVAIGANDGQGFVEDGVTYPFGTDGWKTIYRRRVAAYLAMVESSGATVVWLGLPPMKAGNYDTKIQLVNRLDYEVVSASPQAVWFSTTRVLGDADGHFQDFGSVDGRVTRLRQPDGIHLTDDGAQLIAEKLLPWLAK